MSSKPWEEVLGRLVLTHRSTFFSDIDHASYISNCSVFCNFKPIHATDGEYIWRTNKRPSHAVDHYLVLFPTSMSSWRRS